MEEIFTQVYEENQWGNNQNSEYGGSSGGGSDIDYNRYTYVPFLRNFITENEIKTVVDLGCGDFRCGKLIYEDLDISYTGYDAYKKVVEYNTKTHSPEKYTFHHLDFCNYKEEIVGADMCILKDVIQHWCLESIYKFLDYLFIEKKFKYILICNCCQQFVDNTDIPDGSWRQLSCDYFPLKRYGPVKLFNYATKEVSVIKVY